MKKMFSWFQSNWQRCLLFIISIVVLAIACFYHLEGITSSKLSQNEVVALQSVNSGKVILNDPLFLPYKIGEYLVMKSGFASIYLFRAVSATFGFVLVILFYLLAKRWFSPKIALVSSLMLATSGLFLNYSRLAVPDILLPLGLLALLWSVWWIFQSERTSTKLVLSGVIFAFCLYIPGLVWFMLLAAVVQRRHITAIFKKTPWFGMFVACIVLGLMIAPLVRAIIMQPLLFKEWLALPINFTSQEFARQFIFVPASLVVRSLPNPVFNLGRLPYLDILTICLIALGSYAFLLRLDLVRTRALIGSVVIAWFLIAFTNPVTITLLLPLIYLTVAAGVMFMLQQWYSVFPKNPIARTIGLILLFGVVSISIFYNTNRYFVAWANNPITRLSFQEKIPPNLLQ